MSVIAQWVSYETGERVFRPLVYLPRTNGSDQHLYELMLAGDPFHAPGDRVRKVEEAMDLLWHG
jgi:hypothetical protein